MDDPAVHRRHDGIAAFEVVLPGGLDVGPEYEVRRPRGLGEWVVLLTVDGQGEAIAATPSGPVRVAAPPGHVLALHPHAPQHYRTSPGADRWLMWWVHVRPPTSWLPLLDWPSPAAGIGLLPLPPAQAGPAAAALARAASHHRAALPHAHDFAVNAVEEALLWCGLANPGRDRTDTTVRAVVEHVSDRLDQPHTVSSIAAAVGLSASHLAHVVKRATGDPVMAHVERLRLDAARDLLSVTDLSVAQVATRVGFADPLYFSRRFRAAVGSSPRQWRREHRR